MRNKRNPSKKKELIKKGRESMLAAVEIFNNPNIHFKSETFIVLAIIAWRNLLHAYFHEQGVEYRYYKQKKVNKIFDKNPSGGYKYWELNACIKSQDSPLNSSTTKNIEFFIGLRNEIEHNISTEIHDIYSARFQACCLNFNFYLKKLFGEEYGLESTILVSIQFSTFSEGEIEEQKQFEDLPRNISAYINDFDNQLSKEDFDNQHFAYRVIFFQKTSNHPNQADRVIEFVDPNSEQAQNLNKEYWAIKEKEKKKYKPKDIVNEMQNKGFVKFKIHNHTKLWQNKRQHTNFEDNGYGVWVSNQWYWYSKWFEEVKQYCQDNKERFS